MATGDGEGVRVRARWADVVDDEADEDEDDDDKEDRRREAGSGGGPWASGRFGC